MLIPTRLADDVWRFHNTCALTSRPRLPDSSGLISYSQDAAAERTPIQQAPSGGSLPAIVLTIPVIKPPSSL
ncbi:hypothetical protein BaRGS_00031566 [Batillaria attramentaria]|uniref:Uncharacterized protein n=1 Tax=Batillaria attramentaria TaxID=370345 RepID=A0ABD0JR04_9CAEN